jgi:hypothetical protein
MSTYLLTFGAGGQNYYDAVNRLTTQATNLNFFDKIIGYTDADLKNDFEFWNKHGEFILNNRGCYGYWANINRGYGYWVWKSYIIKKTMETMLNGDVLLYLDCGSEIDINKKQQIMDHFNYVTNDYIISTTVDNDSIISLRFPEKNWTKMDLLLQLDMLDETYLNTPQHQSGTLLIMKCDKTAEIVNKWYELSCDYHNIDDSPSINANLSCFIEHRHDQSILSLLLKKNNVCCTRNLSNCIEINRNRTGKTMINHNVTQNNQNNNVTQNNQNNNVTQNNQNNNVTQNKQNKQNKQNNNVKQNKQNNNVKQNKQNNNVKE